MEAKNKNVEIYFKVLKFSIPIIVSISLMFIETTSLIINIILYSCSMIPLSIILGNQTSDITEYIGEKKGGLLAATVGNLPELMMGLWSIKYGMIAMAQAGLMGAVITNMLLGLGLAIFCGGVKYKEQKFNKALARTNFQLLLLAIASIIIISSLDGNVLLDNKKATTISAVVSIVLIFIYILGLIFSLYTHRNLFIASNDKAEHYTNEKKLNKQSIIIILKIIFVSIILYFISEKLIYNVNKVVETYKVSEEFIGIILIPLLGSFGENATSIVCAMNNKVDCSLETAIGSSIQISLFVTPLLIIISFFMGLNMTLVFSHFQIIMLIIALAMSYFVFQDGKTYWLEGGILTATYVIITIGYYFIGM